MPSPSSVEEVFDSVEHEKIGDDQADEAFLDEEGADDSSVVVVGQVDNEQLPLPPVQFLPPVELVIENEIWQYRYPPFETLFTSSSEVNEGINALGGGSNTIKSHSETLPSYVIGVLDHAELVSGIFNFRTPLGPSTWQPIDSSSISRNTNAVQQQQQHHQFDPIFDDRSEAAAFQNHDQTFRNGKWRPAFTATEEKVSKSGQQRSIVVSDDHWIWKRN